MIAVTVVGDNIVITHGGEKRKHKLSLSDEQAAILITCLEGAINFLGEDHQFSSAVIQDISDES